MSFWLFKPSELLSSKNLLIYKISEYEELLNFLTLLGTITIYIVRKKIDKELLKKISGIFFSIIIFVGCLLHFSKNKENTESIQGMEIPKYADFSHSLTIT